MITGGWNYVWRAYGVTWLVLGIYALSLWVRHLTLKKKEGQ